MGDHLQAGKPSWYVTSHLGLLSLAISLWVGAMSTSESWDVNRHTARCTSAVSVVWQCKLVSGWGLMISSALWVLWLGKDSMTLLFLRVHCVALLVCASCQMTGDIVLWVPTDHEKSRNWMLEFLSPKRAEMKLMNPGVLPLLSFSFEVTVPAEEHHHA